MSYDVIMFVVIPIFLFVVAGYVFRKLGKFDSSQSGNLIGYVMKVAIPCMIIVALASEPVEEYLQYLAFFGTFLLITVIIFIVALIFARLRGMPMLEGSYFSATACLSNTCMIALPILVLLMGKPGAVYGILGVIVLIIGLQVMSVIYDYHHGEDGDSVLKSTLKSLWSAAKQPYFVAMIIGIILSVADLTIPSTTNITLTWLGNTTAPVALFAVGLDLDFSVFKRHLRAICESIVFKLVLMPILAWFLAAWMGLSPAAYVAVVLCSSVASAKCQYALAKQKHIYVEETAAIVASATILSIITLTIVLILLSNRDPNVFKRDGHFHNPTDNPVPNLNETKKAAPKSDDKDKSEAKTSALNSPAMTATFVMSPQLNYLERDLPQLRLDNWLKGHVTLA